MTPFASQKNVLSGICAALAVLLLALTAAPAGATTGFLTDDDSRLATVPHDEDLAYAIDTSGIRAIAVRNDGWDETLRTWARIQLDYLTGRGSIPGQDPVYTVLSLMYEPQRWMDARILPLEHPELPVMLGLEDRGKWISPRDLIENPQTREMQAELLEMQERSDQLREIRELHSAVSQVARIGADQENVYLTVTDRTDVDPETVRRLVENEDAWEQAVAERKELAGIVKQEKPLLEAGARLLDRGMNVFSLHENFYIVPDPDSLVGEWLAAPATRPSEARAAMRIQPASLTEGTGSAPVGGRLNLPTAAWKLDQALIDAFSRADGSQLGAVVSEFRDTVHRSRSYPDAAHLLKMNAYVSLNPMSKAAWIYGLALGLYGLFMFFRTRPWRLAATTVLGLGLLLHTYGVVMRLLLTDRMPVSNMYESVTFTCWCALIVGVGLELWKRNAIIGLSSAAVGFLFMLGVDQVMPLHEQRIHPLRAVLNSYWLNIHVTAMLISYGVLALSAFFGVLYLTKELMVRTLGRDTIRKGATAFMPMPQIELFAYRLIQVAWPILTVGIMLGAVWADTAWGRYWGWDPKETWALITWITYTIYLHMRMVSGKKGWVSAALVVLGFIMVLITWLGVSYIDWFAGGLHTYASPT